MAPAIACGCWFRGAPSILAYFQESRFQPLAVLLTMIPFVGWLSLYYLAFAKWPTNSKLPATEKPKLLICFTGHWSLITGH
jgi:hypothetical protein